MVGNEADLENHITNDEGDLGSEATSHSLRGLAGSFRSVFESLTRVGADLSWPPMLFNFKELRKLRASAHPHL